MNKVINIDGWDILVNKIIAISPIKNFRQTHLNEWYFDLFLDGKTDHIRITNHDREYLVTLSNELIEYMKE